MVHVSPQVHQGLRYLEVSEVFAGDPDVLQPRHQLAIEAAHGVAGKKARALAAQMLVDLTQMRHQRRGLGILVLILRVQQQQLEFLQNERSGRYVTSHYARERDINSTVRFPGSISLSIGPTDTHAEQVLHESGHFLILYKQIVPARDVLHDVPLDLFILQYRVTVVDQNGRWRGLEVGAKIGRRFLHVHSGHLQGDRLQLRQEVQIHEIFLAEETGALPTAVDRRCLEAIFFFVRFIF